MIKFILHSVVHQIGRYSRRCRGSGYDQICITFVQAQCIVEVRISSQHVPYQWLSCVAGHVAKVQIPNIYCELSRLYTVHPCSGM